MVSVWGKICKDKTRYLMHKDALKKCLKSQMSLNIRWKVVFFTPITSKLVSIFVKTKACVGLITAFWHSWHIGCGTSMILTVRQSFPRRCFCPQIDFRRLRFAANRCPAELRGDWRRLEDDWRSGWVGPSQRCRLQNPSSVKGGRGWGGKVNRLLCDCSQSVDYACVRG